jgi:Ca2+-binding RTX toxin-like protein
LSFSPRASGKKADAPGPVVVNLLLGVISGDTLIGDANNNTLRSSDGDDYLEGGDGNDVLDGAFGVDFSTTASAQTHVLEVKPS